MSQEVKRDFGTVPGDQHGLAPGSTLEFSREELLIPQRNEDPLIKFFRVAARDPHIQGVAISRIKGGGIYTAWFVRNFSDREAMRRAMNATDSAYDLLRVATRDETGYGGYISLGDRSFEEAEASYRRDWGVVDPERYPFDLGRPHNSDLDLVGIVRFR